MDELIRKARLASCNPYAYLDGEGGFDAVLPAPESAAPLRVLRRVETLNPWAGLNGDGEFDYAASDEQPARPAQKASQPSAREPEDKRFARAFQLVEDMKAKLWKHRHELWPEGVPTDPVDLLDPEVALQMEGFSFDMADSLGEHSFGGKTIAVAGIIDRPSKSVRTSRQLPFNTRRFTVAHELGHALMHEGMRMHRDRPMDGSNQDGLRREWAEYEADKFATYFLMPEKLVRERFHQAFLCDQFVITEDTLFALDPGDKYKMRERIKTVRDLSKILAKVENYNGRHFYSLAKQFHVSVEAMAIRLEELELVVI